MFEILFLVTLASVIGIVVKIIGNQKCPNDTELRNAVLYRKKSNESNTDRIITHLGICEKCRDRVAEMNG